VARGFRTSARSRGRWRGQAIRLVLWPNTRPTNRYKGVRDLRALRGRTARRTYQAGTVVSASVDFRFLISS
jgi:hypothetical protein